MIRREKYAVTRLTNAFDYREVNPPARLKSGSATPDESRRSTVSSALCRLVRTA